MQYYETREKEYYDVAQGQNRQANGQNHHLGYVQSQTRPVYGRSPTLNHRSHGGFLDGLFKGQNGQKGQNRLGTFLGHKSQEANKGHGHGKLLGQHEKKIHETNKGGVNGLGTFINNGEKKHKKQNEHKKKNNRDGRGSGNESGSSSGSDSD
ncbi:hypothetical protein Bca4012_061135 [Brassica carinata]|uniref:Uncharacterized protein n=1 Tax=Brassica carinata TaxID=52824 RepID=A0A8X7V6N4_BRACI|nr:hypothetical protein Bca52824_031457 [Brassica carinata]